MAATASQSPNDVAIYQLKIVVEGVQPKVWRRVLVPDTATLADLHEIIQGIFDWDDSHLHGFQVGKERFSPPDDNEFMDFGTPARDTNDVRLSSIFVKKVTQIEYEYDFGDSWYHTIKLEKRLVPVPGKKYPEVTAGTGAGPLEDSGGFWGYNDLVELWKQGADDPEEEDRLEWAGPRFNPENFDLAQCNRRLAKYFKPKVIVRKKPTPSTTKAAKKSTGK